MKVTLTKHAREQMAERRITSSEVVAALTYGRVVETKSDPQNGDLIQVVDGLVRGCRLRIILAARSRVVTVVYKTASGEWEAPR